MADDADKTDADKKPPQVLDYDASPEASWGAFELLLLHPFKYANVVYDKLTLRIPNGADIIRFSMSKLVMREILYDLSGLDEKVVGKMRGTDYSRAIDKVGELSAGS